MWFLLDYVEQLHFKLQLSLVRVKILWKSSLTLIKIITYNHIALEKKIFLFDDQSLQIFPQAFSWFDAKNIQNIQIKLYAQKECVSLIIEEIIAHNKLATTLRCTKWLKYPFPKQDLTMDQIESNQIQVGVLQHYIDGQIVINQDENEFYQMWAFPDGIKIYDNRLKIINDPEPQDSFGEEQKITVYSPEMVQGHVTQRPKDFIYSFIHTDYSLNRTYFTALCWHEKKYCPLNKEKLNAGQNKNIYAQRLPKCTLWELQNDPLMIDLNKNLVYVPKVILVASKYPVFIFQREILKFYYRNVLVETSDILINQEKLNNFKDLVNLLGYPQAENYFDHQQTKIVISSKNVKYKRIKKDNLKEFFTAFFFLPKLEREINKLQIIDCCNSSIKFTPLLFNKNICFYKPNLNIISLIKRIGVQNLINLWKCVILQRHILIFSMNNLSVIELCEAIMYLIEPIKWQTIYIPFLPFHLVNNIGAIQGFIIGISKIHMNYIIEHFPMNDIVIFDFDENVIIQNGGNPTDLPDEIVSLITIRLAALGFKKKDKTFLYLFREYPEAMHQSQQARLFKIKQVFFDALLYLLNNYRVFASLNEGGLLEFDRNGYKSMFVDKKWGEFASELVNTMIFVRLCEYHLYEEKILKWNQYTIGGLFVYCQNILASSAKNEKFWAVPKVQKGTQYIATPYQEYFNYVLKSNLDSLNENKKVYQIEDYIIKYLSYLEYSKDNKDYERQENAQRGGFGRAVIDFLFPWVREIENEQRGQFKGNHQNRCSLRLSIQNLPQLSRLFGFQAKQSSMLNKVRVQKLLLDYRSKQSKYLDYKKLGKHNSTKQRISV